MFQIVLHGCHSRGKYTEPSFPKCLSNVGIGWVLKIWMNHDAVCVRGSKRIITFQYSFVIETTIWRHECAFWNFNLFTKNDFFYLAWVFLKPKNRKGNESIRNYDLMQETYILTSENEFSESFRPWSLGKSISVFNNSGMSVARRRREANLCCCIIRYVN